MRLPARSAVILLCALSLLAQGAESVRAASTRRAANPRVAVVLSHSAEPYRQALEGFQHLLTDQVPGLQITLISLDEAGAVPRLRELETADSAPDLILALGSTGTRKVLEVVREIPVVSGLILNSDLLEDAPNATGVVLEFPVEQQMEWISMILPPGSRIGILFSPAENAGRVDEARVAAKKLGLRLVAHEIDSPDEIPAGLNVMSRRADVILGFSDRVVLGRQTREAVLLHSHREQIPFVGLSAAWVEAGALYALERDFNDLGKQCGELAKKILDGSSPKSLKVRTPRTVRLALNTQTSEMMKIDWPSSMWDQATRYPVDAR